MDKKELPINNLIDLNVEKIKNEVLYSNSWDKIIEVRDYCDEILELNDDDTLKPKTMNQTINYIINMLEELKDIKE